MIGPEQHHSRIPKPYSGIEWRIVANNAHLCKRRTPSQLSTTTTVSKSYPVRRIAHDGINAC
jgi:hypothetical protein